METYHKIPAPFYRDPATNKLDEFTHISDEVRVLANTPWTASEKLDGTNIRVHWDGHRVSFAGRTDAAEIPPELFEYLTDTFGGEEREGLFEQTFGEKVVTLFGEGIGPKIQGGGKYGATTRFILFDVKVGELYLEQGQVSAIAPVLGIESAPQLAFPLWLSELVDTVRFGHRSAYGSGFIAEGLVARPVTGVLDRQGRRIIVKIKSRDFYNGRL